MNLDAWLDRQRDERASVDLCVRCSTTEDLAPAGDDADALDCAADVLVCNGCRRGETPARLTETFDPECPL